MSESFFDKLATQLKGALHDAADSMEDAGRTARQIIRDMDVQIGKAEEGLVEVEAEYRQTVSKRDSALALRDKYAGYAAKAVQKGDDAMAKEALLDKRKAQDSVDSMQKQVDSFKPTVDGLKAQIQDLRDRRDEMDRKTGLIEARSAVAEAESRAAEVLGGMGNARSAADTFDRLEEKVGKQEAMAAARSDLAREKRGVSPADKYAALDKPDESSIDDELAQLKRDAGK